MDDPVDDLGSRQTDETIEKISRQKTMLLQQIAEQRWYFAQHVHKLKNGKPMDFEAWPFLEEIYRSTQPVVDLIGSTGWG